MECVNAGIIDLIQSVYVIIKVILLIYSLFFTFVV